MVARFRLIQSSLRCLNKGTLNLISSQHQRISFIQREISLRAMASNSEVEQLKAQAERSQSMISGLEEQINKVRKAAVKEAGLGEEERLRQENEQLRQEVQSLQSKIVMAEINNGVRQIFVPSKSAAAAATAAAVEANAEAQSQSTSESTSASSATATKAEKETAPQKTKQKEESAPEGKKAKGDPNAKKEAGGKPKKAAGGSNAAELPIDASRLDLRIGKIVGVEKHPKADKLYVEQVDLGEGRIRTIVSGLVDHVPIEAMKDRIAVFMCNLKPVKMRDIFSQGMIMCAASPEKTEILVPPTDSEIGDRVTFEDYPGVPDEQMNPKKKIWETLKPDMRTNKDRVATYKGSPMSIKGKGIIVAPSLADSQIS